MLPPIRVDIYLVHSLLRKRLSTNSKLMLVNLHPATIVLMQVLGRSKREVRLRRVHARHVVGNVASGGVRNHSTSEKVNLISHGVLKVGYRSHDRAVPSPCTHQLCFPSEKRPTAKRRCTQRSFYRSFYCRLSIQRCRYFLTK